MRLEVFPDAVQILDFFHLSENLSEFAKAVFDFNETEYKPWVKTARELFKNSRHKDVLDMIAKLGKRRLSKSKFKFDAYIEERVEMIDYAKYKSQGWYIGSGAIESANKTVLQARLKQAGMREPRICPVSCHPNVKSPKQSLDRRCRSSYQA